MRDSPRELPIGCGRARHQRRDLPQQAAISGEHRRHARPAGGDERVAKLAHDALDRSPVNVNVHAAQIAERFLQSVVFRVEEEPSASPAANPRDRHPEFERYVEARSARGSGVELHAGKIVDRIGARIQHPQDCAQSLRAPGHANGGAGAQIQCAQANDVGQVQPLEGGVIRDVEEYCRPTSPCAGQASPFSASLDHQALGIGPPLFWSDNPLDHSPPGLGNAQPVAPFLERVHGEIELDRRHGLILRPLLPPTTCPLLPSPPASARQLLRIPPKRSPVP